MDGEDIDADAGGDAETVPNHVSSCQESRQDAPGNMKPKVAGAVEKMTAAARACCSERRSSVWQVLSGLKEPISEKLEPFGAETYNLGVPTREPMTFAIAKP